MSDPLIARIRWRGAWTPLNPPSLVNCARAKKKSRYLHLSARVDFPFKACESHQQHFSALASFANVLAFCTCVLPISYVGVKVPVIDLIP